MQRNFILSLNYFELLSLLQDYLGKCLSFKWKDFYTLPPIATFNNQLQVFQNKILNNVLYVDKHLSNMLSYIVKKKRLKIDEKKEK